jgi:hypothetical protein
MGKHPIHDFVFLRNEEHFLVTVSPDRLGKSFSCDSIDGSLARRINLGQE